MHSRTQYGKRMLSQQQACGSTTSLVIVLDTHLLKNKVGKVGTDGHWLTLDLENVSSEDLFGSVVHHISHQRACGRTRIWLKSHSFPHFDEKTNASMPEVDLLRPSHFLQHNPPANWPVSKWTCDETTSQRRGCREWNAFSKGEKTLPAQEWSSL